MSYSLRSHGPQYTRLSCPALSSGLCSKSCPLSLWSHPTISSSAALNFSQHQSFPMILSLNLWLSSQLVSQHPAMSSLLSAGCLHALQTSNQGGVLPRLVPLTCSSPLCLFWVNGDSLFCILGNLLTPPAHPSPESHQSPKSCRFHPLRIDTSHPALPNVLTAFEQVSPVSLWINWTNPWFPSFSVLLPPKRILYRPHNNLRYKSDPVTLLQSAKPCYT